MIWEKYTFSRKQYKLSCGSSKLKVFIYKAEHLDQSLSLLPTCPDVHAGKQVPTLITLVVSKQIADLLEFTVQIEVQLRTFTWSLFKATLPIKLICLCLLALSHVVAVTLRI